ncbi:MAG: FKBP-type peptidyl-prolyl cis-trans isomerase [Bacteroidetes bacterium]|nr:FKBP-type peptidyl-prolyl cis-trans isomerase [Bacteroidota bacterium]
MKNVLISLLLLTSISMTAQTETKGPDPVLNNQIDSLSFFLGLSLGYDFQTLPFDANTDLIIAGLAGSLYGTTTYDEETTNTLFRQLQMAIQQKEQVQADATANIKQEETENFLKENGAREGVITTASGLQFEVLVKGEGPMPADTSEVEVHYEGTLLDGTVFDSSYERGESISFPLNRVIAGWTEGVQLMPVGSTFKFYIPSELGYGSRGSGPIPPNSVLIFKIELLGIK